MLACAHLLQLVQCALSNGCPETDRCQMRATIQLACQLFVLIARHVTKLDKLRGQSASFLIGDF